MHHHNLKARTHCKKAKGALNIIGVLCMLNICLPLLVGALHSRKVASASTLTKVGRVSIQAGCSFESQLPIATLNLWTSLPDYGQDYARAHYTVCNVDLWQSNGVFSYISYFCLWVEFTLLWTLLLICWSNDCLDTQGSLAETNRETFNFSLSYFYRQLSWDLGINIFWRISRLNLGFDFLNDSALPSLVFGLWTTQFWTIYIASHGLSLHR